MKVSTACQLAADDSKRRHETTGSTERKASKALLAEVFGVTRQCVVRWGEDVPYLRECELRVAKPHWFPKKTNGKARRR